MTDTTRQQTKRDEAIQKRGKNTAESLESAADAQAQLLRLLVNDALALLRGTAQHGDRTDPEPPSNEDT